MGCDEGCLVGARGCRVRSGMGSQAPWLDVSMANGKVGGRAVGMCSRSFASMHDVDEDCFGGFNTSWRDG